MGWICKLRSRLSNCRAFFSLSREYSILWTSLTTGLLDENVPTAVIRRVSQPRRDAVDAGTGVGGGPGRQAPAPAAVVSSLHPPHSPGPARFTCTPTSPLPTLVCLYNVRTFSYSKINGHNYPVPRPGTCGLAYVGPTWADIRVCHPPTPAATAPRARPPARQSSTPGRRHPLAHRQLANHQMALRYFHL